MEQSDNRFNASWLLEIVKAIVIVSLTIVIAYKLIVTPITLSMDFYALLSLLLALFSVGLSALFYFKATDTSNAFYDNTYKFTKDIAELLVRIESGFGERLRHLDEGYTRMQDRFYPQGLKEEKEIAETQKQVQKEEENLNTKLKERDDLINELLQKSKLDGKEKQDFLAQLKQREEELLRSRAEVSFLRSQAADLIDRTQGASKNSKLLEAVTGYMQDYVLQRFSPAFASAPMSRLMAKWKSIAPDLHPDFLQDLQKLGFATFDNELTKAGAALLRQQLQIRNRTLKSGNQED